MKTKKNIAWIAAVALCLSSSAALVYAEDDLSPAGSSLVDEDITYLAGTVGNGKADYVLDNNGTLTIKYIGNADVGDYSLATELPWYESRGRIRKIVVDEGITRVGNHFFEAYTTVQEVELPSTITTIGENTFYNCTALNKVKNFDKITSFGAKSFAGCISLPETISENVTEIGDSAFNGCTNLRSVTLSASIGGDLGKSAFNGCSGITNVTVKTGVTSISDSAFASCAGISSITLPTTGLTTIGNSAFSGCASLSSLNGDRSSFELPECVTDVGASAFANCTSLPSNAAIDANVGAKAFQNCTSLQKLYVNKDKSDDASVSDVEISEYAFSGCTNLKVVNLEKVSSIGDYAFEKCGITTDALAELTNLTNIGKYAFSYCPLNSGITIPDSVTTIGEKAFAECGQMPKAIIGTGLTKAGNYVFSNCVELSDVTIKDGNTYLGKYMFDGCKKLTKITIPFSVKSFNSTFSGGYIETATINCPVVDKNAFSKSGNLKNVYFSSALTKIDDDAFSGDGLLQDIDFNVCPSLETINSSAFEGCASLTNVTLGANIKTLGASAFKACSGMTGFHTTSTTPQLFKNTGIFSNCSSLVTVDVAADVTDIGVDCFSGCASLTTINGNIIKNSIKTIGAGAFSWCTSLTEVTVPASVSVMNKEVFKECTNLKTITLKNDSITGIGASFAENCLSLESFNWNYDSCTSIGNSAFSGCSKLHLNNGRNFQISHDSDQNLDTIKTIGSYAFSDATLLDTMIPKTVTTIGQGAFKNCITLGTNGSHPINIPDGVTKLENEVFYGCTGLKNMTVSGNVKSIGNSVFENCTGLEYMTIDSGTTSIGSKCFKDCTSLGDFILPNTITKIDGNAFENCVKITDVTMPSGLEKLGGSVFSGCTSLNHIKLSGCSNLTKFSGNTFLNCSSLNVIELPNLKELGVSEFKGCTSLAKITLPGTLEKIGGNCFENCTALTEITIPYAVTGLNNTFKGCINLEYAVILSTNPTMSSPFAGTSCTVACFESAKNVIKDCTKNNIEYAILNGDAENYLSIVVNPKDYIIENAGETATFTVKDVSSGVATYQWYMKRPSDADFTPVSGATGNTYSFAVTQDMVGTAVKCQVTAGGLSAMSTEAYAKYKELSAEEQVRAFVDRLYNIILDRPAEEAGLAGWTSDLLSGTKTSADIVYGLANSEEFHNKALSNDQIVERMYRAMLGRPSDAGGKADWMDAMANGCTVNGIINGFSGSQEFAGVCAGYGIKAGNITNCEPRDKNVNLTAFVSRMYTKALGRSYDVYGLNDWTNDYLNGAATANKIAYGFILSDEFVNRNLSDEAYVDTLYRTFFNREPDEGGKASWLDAMANGASRQDVLDGFLGAEEFANLKASFGV